MIKYTDLYVNTIARGLMNPGEQLVAAAAGTHQPFWSLGIPWFRHSFLVLATTDRLVVVDHRKGLVFDRLDTVASYRWHELGALKLSGIFSKKLVAKDGTNRVVLNMKLPPMLLNPIPGNAVAVRRVVETWEQRRQLAPAPAPVATLPTGQPGPTYYAQPFN